MCPLVDPFQVVRVYPGRCSTLRLATEMRRVSRDAAHLVAIALARISVEGLSGLRPFVANLPCEVAILKCGHRVRSFGNAIVAIAVESRPGGHSARLRRGHNADCSEPSLSEFATTVAEPAR